MHVLDILELSGKYRWLVLLGPNGARIHDEQESDLSWPECQATELETHSESLEPVLKDLKRQGYRLKLHF